VHQHVELGERLGRGLQRLRVGQVERPGGGAETGGDRVEPLGRPAGQQQRVGGRQGLGDRGSDPAAGSCPPVRIPESLRSCPPVRIPESLRSCPPDDMPATLPICVSQHRDAE